MKPFWICLVLAILVHWGILKVPLLSGIISKQNPIESPDWIYLEPNVRKTIVQTSKLPDYDSSAWARFGGEFKNRVPKEMKAPRMGRFHEGENGSPSLPERAGDRPSLSSLMAFGASPHELGDIGVGNQTLLNTDPVLYASFMNRVADEIYDAWVEHAREAISDHIKSARLEANVYVTKLQIVMDELGNVQGIQTLKSSGIEELDEAPRRAFLDVGSFPNPPVQMFKQERQVRFIYEFHYHLRTSLFNIVPWG